MAHHGRSGPAAVPAGNRGSVLNSAKKSAKGPRGRTAKTTAPDRSAGPRPTEGRVWQELKTEANRPIGTGGGKKRGDRQNMDPDPGMRGNTTATKRGNRRNIGLRNDRNPTSVAGRRNRVPNEGG